MSLLETLLAAGLVAAFLPVIAMGLTLLVGAPLSERRCQQSANAQAVALLIVAAGLCISHVAGDSPARELRLPALLEFHGYQWTPVFLLDRLSLAYVLLVALIYPVVVRFSIPAFHREPGAQRYWFLVSLLALALWLVSLAGNIDVLFVGWELVGVCSVSLIAFFRANPRSTQNSLRTLVYYRICDAGMLFAVVLIHHDLASADFLQFGPGASAASATAIGLLILFSSLAKSAQLPMSPWLHRAMEGPAASSAIFYGALSVHLGPWLLLRTEPLWGEQFVVRAACAIVGVSTAVYGSLVGRTRSDAKTAIAYATMSQLGVMYVEVALGLHEIALAHLWAHAGLRTWQFLRSSSLIQDFQANPLVGADVKLRLRTGVGSALGGSRWERRVYLAAVRQFWLDALEWRMFARPLLSALAGVQWLEARIVGAGEPTATDKARGGLAGFVVGLLLAASIWFLREPLALSAVWLAFGAWTVVRGLGRSGAGLPLLALVGGAAGAVALYAPDMPQWALALCLLIGSGVAPAHLWLESLRRSLGRADYAIVLVAQPFVALLHGFVHAHPTALEPHTLEVLQVLFVGAAVLQAGLGLVRSEPERVLGAILQSQSALVLAGAAAGEHGWDAARTMLVSLMGCGAVLLAITLELRRRFGALSANSQQGLAERAPALHRLFGVCGWLCVGLPGGVAFFAEDLLFHALVEHSVAATAGFIVAAAFNALAFYRLYLGLFGGPERATQDVDPKATERWKLALLTAAVLVLLLFGFAPALLLPHA